MINDADNTSACSTANKWASILFPFLALLLCFLATSDVFASHNRAGEISYIHAPTNDEEFRYEFTITIYAATFQPNGMPSADRDSLELHWGDNTNSTLYRQNGPEAEFTGIPEGEIIAPGIRKNIYDGVHVYDGLADFYVIGMQDPNRNQGIINVDTSFIVPFYLEDTLFIPDPLLLGYNSSPVFSLPPIDFAEVGAVFIHNPTVFDPDGDVLHFELITPLAFQSEPVLGYVSPDQLEPGPNNSLSLNSETGEVIWDSPQFEEEFNIAILITETRNGETVGTSIRDMQIHVKNTGNQPPQISETNNTFVIVGDTIDMAFTATDASDQEVEFTAFGIPFALPSSPADFDVPVGFQSPPVTGNFQWITTPAHLFSEAYTVVFKAEDNFSLPDFGPIPLTDIQTWNIFLKAPGLGSVELDTTGGANKISWDADYTYSSDEKFTGFSVWRKVGCDADEFEDGEFQKKGSAYIKVAERIDANNFVDNDLTWHDSFSYRVVAEFAQSITAGGVPINEFQSMPSAQMCFENPYATGIEVANSKELSFYPNPASDYIQVQLKSKSQIELFTQEGKRVLSEQLNEGSNKVDLLDLPSGIYVIKIFNEVDNHISNLIIE